MIHHLLAYFRPQKFRSQRPAVRQPASPSDKSAILSLRLTPHEKHLVARLSKARGQRISVYVAQLVRAHLQAALAKPQKPGRASSRQVTP